MQRIRVQCIYIWRPCENEWCQKYVYNVFICEDLVRMNGAKNMYTMYLYMKTLWEWIVQRILVQCIYIWRSCLWEWIVQRIPGRTLHKNTCKIIWNLPFSGVFFIRSMCHFVVLAKLTPPNTHLLHPVIIIQCHIYSQAKMYKHLYIQMF